MGRPPTGVARRRPLYNRTKFEGQYFGQRDSPFVTDFILKRNHREKRIWILGIRSNTAVFAPQIDGAGLCERLGSKGFTHDYWIFQLQ